MRMNERTIERANEQRLYVSHDEAWFEKKQKDKMNDQKEVM